MWMIEGTVENENENEKPKSRKIIKKTAASRKKNYQYYNLSVKNEINMEELEISKIL